EPRWDIRSTFGVIQLLELSCQEAEPISAAARGWRRRPETPLPRPTCRPLRAFASSRLRAFAPSRLRAFAPSRLWRGRAGSRLAPHRRAVLMQDIPPPPPGDADAARVPRQPPDRRPHGDAACRDPEDAAAARAL